jgi:hypothetical protein
MDDDDRALSVEELVEYCRTQAGLLSGHVERIGAETDELLDEIDEDIAELRTHLPERADSTDGPTASPTTAGGTDARSDLAELEELESELEEKQMVAEAKQARMRAFQELAAAYVELAEELEATDDDGRTALDRVVRFERDHDAPVYFDERLTLLEAAAESDGPATE